MADELERRDLLKIAAAAAYAGKLAEAQGQTRFFSPDDFALVDELSEIIIPADEHSPGARAAAVAAYIDSRLGETLEPEKQEAWRRGLKLVNQISDQMNGQPFMKATPAQRVAVVERMARNETDPQNPEEVFFSELKRATVRAYYTSKIGIHQEMEYKGNVYLKEFAGTELP